MLLRRQGHFNSFGVDIITEANLRAANVEAYCDALTRVDIPGEKRGAWEPTHVVGTYSIEKEHVLYLAVSGPQDLRTN